MLELGNELSAARPPQVAAVRSAPRILGVFFRELREARAVLQRIEDAILSQVKNPDQENSENAEEKASASQ